MFKPAKAVLELIGPNNFSLHKNIWWLCQKKDGKMVHVNFPEG